MLSDFTYCHSELTIVYISGLEYYAHTDIRDLLIARVYVNTGLYISHDHFMAKIYSLLYGVLYIRRVHVST